MRKIGTILMGLAFVAITSCGDSPNNQADNTNDKDQAESPLGRELTEAEKRGMKLMKSRQDAKRRTVSDKSKNKSSTYRYLASSDEYPIFSNLVKKSGVNKYMHSSDVTVLAPTDEAFENFPLYKDLLLPGNEEALNLFISYHIVTESLEYKAFSDGDSWTVHAGPTLELSKEGGVYFGGAHVRSGCIETDKGSIIGMDDIIFFPELGE